MNKSNQNGKSNWLTWKSPILKTHFGRSLSPFLCLTRLFLLPLQCGRKFHRWSLRALTSKDGNKVNPKYLSQIPPNNADEARTKQGEFLWFSLTNSTSHNIIFIAEYICFRMRRTNGERAAKTDNVLLVKRNRLITFIAEFSLFLIIMYLWKNLLSRGVFQRDEMSIRGPNSFYHNWFCHKTTAVSSVQRRLKAMVSDLEPSSHHCQLQIELEIVSCINKSGDMNKLNV